MVRYDIAFIFKNSLKTDGKFLYLYFKNIYILKIIYAFQTIFRHFASKQLSY